MLMSNFLSEFDKRKGIKTRKIRLLAGVEPMTSVVLRHIFSCSYSLVPTYIRYNLKFFAKNKTLDSAAKNLERFLKLFFSSWEFNQKLRNFKIKNFFYKT